MYEKPSGHPEKSWVFVWQMWDGLQWHLNLLTLQKDFAGAVLRLSKKRCWWVSEFCNKPCYRTQDKGNRLALWKDVHYQEYLAKASTTLKPAAETWKFPFEKEKSSTKPFWGRAESSTERCLKHLYAFVCSSSLIERFFLPKVMDIKWWNTHNMLTCVLRAFRHDFFGCSLSWWPGNVYISLEFVKVFDESLKGILEIRLGKIYLSWYLYICNTLLFAKYP